MFVMLRQSRHRFQRRTSVRELRKWNSALRTLLRFMCHVKANQERPAGSATDTDD